MSLITRVGAENANSFVTLAWAERTLQTLVSDLSSWTVLSTFDKEYRLILAAAMIGLLPLRGRKTYLNQNLAFPRVRLRPRDSKIYGSDYGSDYTYGNRVSYELPDDYWEYEENCRKIPMEVKTIQCLIAYHAVHLSMAEGQGAAGQFLGDVRSLSVPGMSVSLDAQSRTGNVFDKFWNATQGAIYVLMHKWLGQFRGGAVQALTDANFFRGYETLPTSTTSTETTTSTTASTSSTSSTVSTTSTSSTSTTTTTAP